jgi:hypothetical protein
VRDSRVRFLLGTFLCANKEKYPVRAARKPPNIGIAEGDSIQNLDSGFHRKLLLRFRYFHHPWRSRRNDGNGAVARE